MTYMKQLFDISSNISFYILLVFLFMINLSIAACYLTGTFLLLVFVVSAIKTRKCPLLPGYFKFFVLYGALTLVSTIFSIQKLNSLKDNRELLVFLLIPMFLVILNSRKRLVYSLYAVLGSALVSAMIGIFTTIKEWRISLDHRLHGLTSHWMTYSGLLMLVFIFFFVYLFFLKDKSKKLMLAGGLSLILASILLSLTRSVWVGIFLALGIFLVYYKPKILYAAIPALIILILILPPSVKSRVTSIFDPQNATNKDRFYMYSIAVDIFKDFPLFGVGANNIQEVYDRYKPPEAQQTNLHLHNNFLHILAERGIFVLMALLAAFITLFALLVRKIKGSEGLEKTIALSTLFAFIGFLVAGLFEYNFGDSEIKFLLLYFISIPFLPTGVFSDSTKPVTG